MCTIIIFLKKQIYIISEKIRFSFLHTCSGSYYPVHEGLIVAWQPGTSCMMACCHATCHGISCHQIACPGITLASTMARNNMPRDKMPRNNRNNMLNANMLIDISSMPWKSMFQGNMPRASKPIENMSRNDIFRTTCHQKLRHRKTSFRQCSGSMTTDPDPGIRTSD